jgi:chromate reductase, NAD(P)H dehydrogenase (quinone)
MYTIISGTNRHNSHTEIIAKEYQRLLKEKRIDAAVFFLKDMNVLERNEAFTKLERQYLIPATKFVFIVPEYHGSYPGVVKLMMDITDSKTVWWGKKALLTGVSTGRAGNLRGMEHITGVLNHMKVVVHPNKLPISVVDTILDENGSIVNAATLLAINQQLDEFINF